MSLYAPAFGPRHPVDTDLGPTEDPDENAGYDVPDEDPIDRLHDPAETEPHEAGEAA